MESKPIMRVFCKRDFEAIKGKYTSTVSTTEKKILNAKDLDVLVLQTQFRNGKHWIDNVWILNEESEDVFMELMFGDNDTQADKGVTE